MTYARLALLSGFLAAGLSLASCAGKPRAIGAPQVLIQSLQLLPSTNRAELKVLIHNFSNVPMTFDRLEYRLQLAGEEAASGTAPIGFEVPQDSAEPVTFSLQLSDSALDSLNQGSESTDGSVGYTLVGKVVSSSPSRVFPVNYAGKLSKTPGKPGAWR